jgi:hypothetical protein
MAKLKTLIPVTLFCCAALIVSHCNLPTQSSQANNAGHGLAKVSIAFAVNSPFQMLARTAQCKISASEMDTMTQNLTITSTSVEGEITQIPAGLKRLFEVTVFDSSNVACYQGSEYADIIADSTAMVFLTLFRIGTGGNAVINGSISENLKPSTPPLPEIAVGLVAYYPFTGNAADESDHGFNGIVNGATLTTDRFGRPNKAYYFNGNAGISSPVNTTLSLTKFTLSAWFKNEGTSVTIPRIVAVVPPGSCNAYYGLLQANGEWNGYIDRSRRLVGMINDPQSSYGYTLNYSYGTPDSSSWHHGVVTYSGGVMNIYLDGVLDRVVSVAPRLTQFTQSANLEIGFCSGGGRYIGKLDDVRIYNRVLSQTEIRNVFSSSN